MALQLDLSDLQNAVRRHPAGRSAPYQSYWFENRLLSQDIATVPSPCVITENMMGKIVATNPAACDALGYAAEELIKMSLGSVTHPDFLGETIGARGMVGESGSVTTIKRFLRADGTSIGAQVFASAHPTIPGLTVWSFFDLGLTEELQQATIAAARVDPLTGVLRRESFFEVATGRRATGARCGLLFCDLNGFKAVNDQLGHSAGDRVLQEIAKRLQQVVRAHDVIGRYGGDEFVVLLDNVWSRSGLLVAARTIDHALSLPLASSSGLIVSASIGGVRIDENETIQTSVDRADRAMYQAKERHRRGETSVVIDERREDEGDKSSRRITTPLRQR